MIKANSSFTVFIVESLEKAKSFYANHFGFGVVFENEWYLHLISESGIEVGFLLPNQPTQPDIFHRTYNGIREIFSLEVDDAKSAYSEAKEKSPNVVF